MSVEAASHKCVLRFEALSAAAERELVYLTAGTPPADVLKHLTATWNEIDRKTPLETRLRWRKMAAGVN